MKFNRDELLTRIDETIERGKANAQRAQEEHDAKAARHRTAWLLERGPIVADAAAKVLSMLEQGDAPTRDDVHRLARDRYSEGILLYVPLSDDRPRDFDPNPLLTLRAALAASPDVEVTTAGLKEIGFRDIQRLFSGR